MEYRKVQQFDELEYDSSCCFIEHFIWQPGGLVICVVAMVFLRIAVQELLASF